MNDNKIKQLYHHKPILDNPINSSFTEFLYKQVHKLMPIFGNILTTLTAYFINKLINFGQNCNLPIFFFFNRSSAPVCIGETPVGSPYAHMSTPTGCSYQPRRGWYTLRYTNPEGFVYRTPTGSGYAMFFFFVVARSAFGFPAPLPPLRGGTGPRWGPVTLRLMCAHACTCVRVRKILATLTAN